MNARNSNDISEIRCSQEKNTPPTVTDNELFRIQPDGSTIAEPVTAPEGKGLSQVNLEDAIKVVKKEDEEI